MASSAGCCVPRRSRRGFPRPGMPHCGVFGASAGGPCQRERDRMRFSCALPCKYFWKQGLPDMKRLNLSQCLAPMWYFFHVQRVLAINFGDIRARDCGRCSDFASISQEVRRFVVFQAAIWSFLACATRVRGDAGVRTASSAHGATSASGARQRWGSRGRLQGPIAGLVPLRACCDGVWSSTRAADRRHIWTRVPSPSS